MRIGIRNQIGSCYKFFNVQFLYFRQINRRDAGYTLDGLAFVLAVFGILAGIAVSSILGNRNNAFDKDAQASVNVVSQAAKTHYQNYGDFSDGTSSECGSATSSRVVSVQGVSMWNSGNESLGCQGFYAVALSSSGSCWAARLTVEGRYLATGSVSPIVLATEINTSNSAITPVSNLAINGLAYGALKPQTSGADGTNTNGIAAIATACSAATQSTGVATLAGNYIAPSQFYSNWRDVTAATTTTTTTTTTTLPTTCAAGGTCIRGDTGPGGGIVFYVAAAAFTSTGSDCGTGCRYFEVTTGQLSTSSPYASRAAACYAAGSDTGNMRCDENSIYSNTAGQSSSRTAAAAIGMGMANTNQIYARLTTAGSVSTSSYSAGIAWAYSNNSKTDWHLPSRSELNQMCKWIRGQDQGSDATTCNNSGSLNSGRNATGFLSGTYWSSTEGVTETEYIMYTPDGTQGNGYKYGNFNVRAVRAF